ncbi:MAG: hypothetical protein MUO40_02785 [Anaerolineaceae bacterium]|nr:hypothetical protein [Anaerolineaceae bacterium]
MSRKEELIAGLIEARRQILDSVTYLPPEKRDEVFLGRWFIRENFPCPVGVMGG